MNLLSPEHTLLVTGGVGRASTITEKDRLAIRSIGQETRSLDPSPTIDPGRSLPAARVIPSVDETSSGLIHRHRFIRFDANRLAPGDTDFDKFNGFNDQDFAA